MHRGLQQWVHSLTLSPNTSWVWSSSSFPAPELKTQGMFASHSLDTVQCLLFSILLPLDKKPGAAQSPLLTRSASIDFEVAITLLLTSCMALGLSWMCCYITFLHNTKDTFPCPTAIHFCCMKPGTGTRG